jgi:hypothetical protein
MVLLAAGQWPQHPGEGGQQRLVAGPQLEEPTLEARVEVFDFFLTRISIFY